MKLTLESLKTGAIYNEEHDGFIVIGIDKPKQDSDYDNSDRFDFMLYGVDVWDSLISLSCLIGGIIDKEIKGPKFRRDIVRTVEETIEDAIEFDDTSVYRVEMERLDEESKTDE